MKYLQTTALGLSLALAGASAFAAEPRSISVHVLDQVHGEPAPSVGVTLEEQASDHETWSLLSQQTTNAQGRVGNLLPAKQALHKGIYRVTFATGDWFTAHTQSTFFPSVTVTFRVDDPAQGYHIPLLLSPYGYSTYRGN